MLSAFRPTNKSFLDEFQIQYETLLFQYTHVSNLKCKQLFLFFTLAENQKISNIVNLFHLCVWNFGKHCQQDLTNLYLCHSITVFLLRPYSDPEHHKMAMNPAGLSRLCPRLP